jgi:hypothetical protein
MTTTTDQNKRLVLEAFDTLFRKAQLRKDSVWKSEPLEQELLHKRSQSGH